MVLRAFRPSLWRPSRLRRPAGATTRQSMWADSTHQTLRWQRARYAGRRWAFWQYTSTGVVPGVPGECDINVFAGSQKNWRNWVASVYG